jgi:hypothetical protein
MRTLEERGDDYSRRVLMSSPMYGQYLERKAEDEAQRKDDYLSAATKNYKSDLTPADFEALGIPIPKKYEKGVMDFLGLIDGYQKKMDRLYAKGKFGTDEYRDLYFKYKDAVAKGKKNSTVAKILDRNPVDWLVSGPHALNEPHYESFGTTGKKRPADARQMQMWKNIRNEFFINGMTPKRVLKVRRQVTGAMAENFDESVRAWCWAYVKYKADQGRTALASSDNPYGWYKGWTVDSSYGETMQKWLEKELDPLLDGTISPAFLEEWKKANKSAGGNLLSDFIDLSH